MVDRQQPPAVADSAAAVSAAPAAVTAAAADTEMAEAADEAEEGEDIEDGAVPEEAPPAAGALAQNGVAASLPVPAEVRLLLCLEVPHEADSAVPEEAPPAAVSAENGGEASALAAAEVRQLLGREVA